MSETNSGLEALLKQLGQGNGEPWVQIVADLLGKMTQNDQPDVKRQLSRLGKTVRRLKRERDLLIERNRTIAFGLGACECWGTDRDCLRCSGLGVPGYFIPEEREFVELVLPLLQSRLELVSSYLKELDGQEGLEPPEGKPLN